jgi:hypothetical protein
VKVCAIKFNQNLLYIYGKEHLGPYSSVWLEDGNFDKFYSMSLVLNERDRHCTYNVTLKRFRATIVAVEEQ